MENVPRIATRGRWLLDLVIELLEAVGYAVAETTHNCGELGGLAQNRHRYLLVARLRAKIGPFLYEPPKRALRTIGEVIGDLPVPGPHTRGLHRLPQLQWKTWVRLALIEAGSDWRSLEKLAVVDGYLRDIALVRGRYFGDTYGVRSWDGRAAAVTGRAHPSTGPHSVADPRAAGWKGRGKYRVADFDGPSGTVIAESHTGNGAFVVADPRATRDLGRYEPYGVLGWDDQGRTVTSEAAPGAGPYSVADPRLDCDAADRKKRRFNNILRLVRWEEAGGCVTGASGAHQSVADPRVPLGGSGTKYRTGFYGVKRLDEPSDAVTGSARHDNGRWSVADDRLPTPAEKCHPLIVALDGTWHRPFTTLELGALQSFPVDLELDLDSDSRCREWIGNSVPPEAAEAIASEMAETLLLAWAGRTFQLSAKPIWVRPISTALSIDIPQWRP